MAFILIFSFYFNLINGYTTDMGVWKIRDINMVV